MLDAPGDVMQVFLRNFIRTIWVSEIVYSHVLASELPAYSEKIDI